MRSGNKTVVEIIEEMEPWVKEVMLLRELALSVGLEETIKWGNIVYFANGPVALIRAEETRVLFGFWRGKRLVEIEPALKPSGKYEMATIQLGEGTAISAVKVTRLVRAARALNEKLGDPTKDAPKPKAKRARAVRRPPGKK